MPTKTKTDSQPKRGDWRKRARAVLVGRSANHAGAATRFQHAVKLMGPSDGSGCLPPGEMKVHQTTWRSTKQKAVTEAVTFCDGLQIRITEFPSGFRY